MEQGAQNHSEENKEAVASNFFLLRYHNSRQFVF
jgi:hypothetical protein